MNYKLTDRAAKNITLKGMDDNVESLLDLEPVEILSRVAMDLIDGQLDLKPKIHKKYIKNTLICYLKKE